MIDLLKALKDCDLGRVQDAIKDSYKRTRSSSSEETEDSHKKGLHNSGGTIQRSSSDGSIVFQGRNPQKLEHFEHSMNHFNKTQDINLFNKLVDQGRFERDRRIFQNENITFVWSMEHFFHLLYIYTREFWGNLAITNAILKMFDRASTNEKVNILREFCTDSLPFEFKDTMPFVFHDHIEEILCGKIIDLIKGMYILYIKNIVHDIADFRMHNEEIVLDYYRAYHFYDLLKREDFIRDCTIEVPGDTTDEGIVNLIDFVTLRSGFGGGYDGEQMATSEFKANIILPALRTWFKTHSVNLLMSERIDEWIKKSDGAIDYWKGDGTGLDDLRKYAEGARLVKKFLEDLKAMKGSHVGYEERKISE